MRIQRQFYKPRNEGHYLHVYNHTVAMKYGQLPLNDTEKEAFQRILERHLLKYNIDLISLVIMGNHFHMLIYCHPDKLKSKEAVKVYKKFHNWRIRDLIMHSNNLSEFMREVQMNFSLWFNKTRPYKKRGTMARSFPMSADSVRCLFVELLTIHRDESGSCKDLW